MEVETANGDWVSLFAPADIEARLETLPPPTSRLRIINPFDPVVRDRNRLKRLFGFDYRIEIFVPAAKRRFGYYVFPILEGDRFVGRIEGARRSHEKAHSPLSVYGGTKACATVLADRISWKASSHGFADSSVSTMWSGPINS